MASKLFFVASDVGVFEKLAEGPKTLNDLVQQIKAPMRTVRILADAMTAVGLLELHGNTYKNSAAAHIYLAGRGKQDLRPLVRYLDQLNYPMWMELEKVVRTGQPVDIPPLTEAKQRIYSEGVEAFTIEAATALSETYEFTQHRRILDVGGGTGSFLLAILSRYKHLKAALFERLQVAAVARQRLAGTEFSDQIEIVEGNFFTDDLPENYDAFIVANVVHLLSPEHNIHLLQRIRNHASTDARLLLVDFWTDATHTQPLFAALMAGAFLLRTGEGDVYSDEDVDRWLKSTGWCPLERKNLGSRSSVIIAAA
jgi:SAM-dependent methyltransferase